MDQIIKDLKEHKLFNNGILRGIIYILTLLYSFLVIWIIFDTIFGYDNLYDVDKVSGSISSIGIFLYLLTFVSLVSGGAKQIEENKVLQNNEERLLLFLYKNNNKFTKNDIETKLFKEEFGRNIDSSCFSDLKSNGKNIYSGLRNKFALGPLISYEKGKNVTLTNEGTQFVKENLLEK